MNKKLFIILIICIIIVGIVIGINYYNNSNINIEKLEVRLGEKFSLIEEYNDKYILDYRQADLNKDKRIDDILLIADKEKASDNYAKNMLVVVRNCSNGKIYKYILKGLEGYRAHIEICNLIDSDVPQIIFSTDSGQKKKEKQFIILKYEKGKFKEIFGLEYNKGIQVEGVYKDNYAIQMNILNINKNFELDIKDKKDFYYKNNIYDEENKLINKEVIVKSKNIDSLEQFVLEDGEKGIITTQKVIGINKTDILDEFKVIWKLEKDTLKVVEIQGQRCGKIL